MPEITLQLGSGEVGLVLNLFDEDGRRVIDPRDAMVVACQFPVEPQFRLYRVTPEHCFYTQKTLH